MTPKSHITPGSFVIVTNAGNGVNGPVTLTEEGNFLSGHICPQIGDILEITNKPKKVDGINLVKVQYRDRILDAYYCHIRFSTKPI